MRDGFANGDLNLVHAAGNPAEEEVAVEMYYMKYLQNNCDHCMRQGGTCMLNIRPAILAALRAKRAPEMHCGNILKK